jgi:hypothetical protein
MRIRFGYRNLEFPSDHLGELRESQDLLGDPGALWQRLKEDGYILMRRLINRETVLTGRHTILEAMRAQQALVPGTPLLDGVMPPGGKSVRLRENQLTQDPTIRNILENQALFDLFDSLFGEPSLTFPFKWMRAIGNEQYTAAHYDYVYMGRGSGNLYTAWIPFGDIPIEQGTLAICRGSHNLESFARIRDTYGRMDVDRDRIEGHFERDPMDIIERFGGRWLGANCGAGDVIIFGMHTMHASTTNLTNRFRLSCDVRFQPASEPMDERWATLGRGHYASVQRDMHSARQQWGL